MINDFRQLNPSFKNFTEDNFLEFVKFFNPSNEYYYKLQDFIKIRGENKQQNNDEETGDWEKFSTKCLLIAIKMGNFSSINLYFDELVSYVKRQKNLNEKEKSELLRTELKSAVDYFNTEDNNIYVSAITNIFEKEREKLNQTNQITGDNNNSHKEMMPNTESELGKNKTKILELSESIDSFSDKENEIKTQILRKSIDNFSNEQSEQQEENNDIQEKCGCCLIS